MFPFFVLRAGCVSVVLNWEQSCLLFRIHHKPIQEQSTDSNCSSLMEITWRLENHIVIVKPMH